jgi:ribulose-phosphate 3-epimerase
MAELSPAILTNDVSDFRKQYAELLPLSQYYGKLHVDFADGRFVRTQTVLPADVAFLQSNRIPAMAHLMVQDPVRYFEDCRRAGFAYVLFHFEAFLTPDEIPAALSRADQLGLIAGLALGPDTTLTKIAKFIPQFKLIQIMSIQPGAQGREFILGTFDKVAELRSLSKSVIICVDGGIKVGIAGQLARAGADILVVGSAISRSEDEGLALEALKLDLETYTT